MFCICLRSFWKGRRFQRFAWFNGGYKYMCRLEAGFASDLTPRAVLFFPLIRPMMRCIMAGMTQKDSCPRSSSSSLSCCGGRSPWSSDHGEYTVAVRQGFFVPVCWFAAPQVQVVEVTVTIPQLRRVRHPHVVDIRVVAQRQVPLVCLFMQTIELPHLQFTDKLVYVPVGQVEQVS